LEAPSKLTLWKPGGGGSQEEGLGDEAFGVGFWGERVGVREKSQELRTEVSEGSEGKYSWDQGWSLRVSRIFLCMLVQRTRGGGRPENGIFFYFSLSRVARL
jgi:hypothetical protein